MKEPKEKNRVGRPHKNPEGRGQKVMTYLPPDVVQWLKSQPDGVSQAIARLVRDRMGQ